MKKPNPHARALSKIGASKGGKARASVLTPKERSEIASMAVKTRWAKKKGVPIEEIGGQVSSVAETKPETSLGSQELLAMFYGELEIGKNSMSCYVLSDGSRVVSKNEVAKVLSGTRSGDLKGRLSVSNISKYIDVAELEKRSKKFKIPTNPKSVTGYDALLLVEICDAYLKARDNEKLTSTQRKLAKQAEIIIRSCAKVGIIALIDEATGYQKVRAKNALKLKLQAFIAEEMQEWARQFPEEFFYELARLENVHYSPRNRPLRWGKYIMNFVYRAIDKDVVKELKRRIPNPRKGENLHQWLQEYGKEKLNAQIYQVLGIMKTCKTMDEFRAHFKRVFQKSPFEQLSFLDLADASSSGSFS